MDLNGPFVFANGRDFMARHGEILRERDALETAFAAGCAQILADAFAEHPLVRRFQVEPAGEDFVLALWLGDGVEQEEHIAQVLQAIYLEGETLPLEGLLSPGARSIANRLGRTDIERARLAFQAPLSMMSRHAPGMFALLARPDGVALAQSERGDAVAVARSLGMSEVASLLESRAIAGHAKEGSGTQRSGRL